VENAEKPTFAQVATQGADHLYRPIKVPVIHVDIDNDWS